MVEFAIAATVALTLIFGIIEFGRALFAYDLVAHVARVGTRYAIVNAGTCVTSQTTCETAIRNYIYDKAAGADKAQFTPVPAIAWQQVNGANCYTAGCYVSVTVDYNFTFVALPLPSQTLHSASQMIISQ